MTPATQTMASTLVQGLQTEGATNLWDGLRVALSQVSLLLSFSLSFSHQV